MTDESTRSQTMRSWLDRRLALHRVRELAAHKTVPRHRATPLYYFGGMTIFFFVVQIVTGMLLMLYYRPAASEAFESVEFIMTTVPFGWLVRSLHSWSANLMIFFAAVHLVTVFFLKAYRPPREITWMTGWVLFLLLLGFGFSGYLLPWNQLAFFATKVGTDIASSVPLVGEWLVRFLRGGDRVTGATLSRFYGWHVAILPALSFLLLGLHVVLVQVHGMSVPKSEEDEARRRRPMRFFPHFALREALAWTLALGCLAAIAALFPWELGEKADPFVPAFADIRPEWYFMFLFETLKLVPGGEILSMEMEAIPILLSGVAAALVFFLPLLDRRAAETGRSPGWTVAGVVALVYVVGMTARGYHSWVPVWIALATVAGIFLLLRFAGTAAGETPPSETPGQEASDA